MIQPDGLGAVITVYPIAILLLAVEVRGMQPFLATSRASRRALIVGGIASFLVVLLAVSAVTEAVKVQLYGDTISLYANVVIIAGGAGLGLLVPIALMLLMFDRVGIWEAISRRAGSSFQSQTAKQRLDWFDRIERFNPSAPKLDADTRAELKEAARLEDEVETERRLREARRFGDSDIDPSDDV